MEYTSTLEILEGFSNALSRCSEHRVGAWVILYPLVKVRGSLELLIVSSTPWQGSLFTLSQL